MYSRKLGVWTYLGNMPDKNTARPRIVKNRRTMMVAGFIRSHESQGYTSSIRLSLSLSLPLCRYAYRDAYFIISEACYMLWLVSWYNFRWRWEVHLYYWYHSCWYRLKNGAGERVACMYFGLMQDSLYGFANQMTQRNMFLAISVVFIRGIIEMSRLKRLQLLSLDRGCFIRCNLQ